MGRCVPILPAATGSSSSKRDPFVAAPDYSAWKMPRKPLHRSHRQGSGCHSAPARCYDLQCQGRRISGDHDVWRMRTRPGSRLRAACIIFTVWGDAPDNIRDGPGVGVVNRYHQ